MSFCTRGSSPYLRPEAREEKNGRMSFRNHRFACFAASRTQSAPGGSDLGGAAKGAAKRRGCGRAVAPWAPGVAVGRNGSPEPSPPCDSRLRRCGRGSGLWALRRLAGSRAKSRWHPRCSNSESNHIPDLLISSDVQLRVVRSQALGSPSP